MIDILFKEHKSAKEVLEEEQDNKKIIRKICCSINEITRRKFKRRTRFCKTKRFK